MTERSFKVGDVVSLASGGDPMTVFGVKGNYVDVGFFPIVGVDAETETLIYGPFTPLSDVAISALVLVRQSTDATT